MPAVRPRRGKIVLAVLMAGFAGFAGPATAADTFVVAVDQARLMRVPDRTATIIVGNPLIADVSLQSGGMLVVTGKGYGSTNFLALDRSGNVLSDQQLIVQSSPAATSKPQAPSGQSRVYLQFGAFSARENAAALAQQLNRQIAQIEYRDAQVQMHNDLYRVQIGPYQNRTEAINAAYRIQQQTGLSPSVAVR